MRAKHQRANSEMPTKTTQIDNQPATARVNKCKGTAKRPARPLRPLNAPPPRSLRRSTRWGYFALMLEWWTVR
eukprot:5655587-Lingulodinium_polyedra.AAC.1